MGKKKLRKPRRFFFHYNKPASLKAGTPKLSVHVNKQCHIVDKVVCNVLVESKINKRQPRVVMQGFANSFVFSTNKDNQLEALITNVKSNLSGTYYGVK